MSCRRKLFSRRSCSQFPANAMPRNHDIVKRVYMIFKQFLMRCVLKFLSVAHATQLTKVQKHFKIFNDLFLSNLGKAFALITADEAHRQKGLFPCNDFRWGI